MYAIFGLYVSILIILERTSNFRYKLKLKLISKYRAKFRIGECVSVEYTDGNKILCKVVKIHTDRKHIQYLVQLLVEYNSKLPYEYVEDTWFDENMLHKVI